MDKYEMEDGKFATIVLESIVDLHAKMDVMTNLTLSLLAAIEKKPVEEYIAMSQEATQKARARIVQHLYAQYGRLPDDLQDLIT